MEGVNEVDAFVSFIKDEENNSKTCRGQKGKYQKKSAAAGFKEDATKILKAFAGGHGLAFSHFGKLWKDGHYALLYMGKESEKELCEATYEMYKITLSFITDQKLSFNMKVGAIYLLYMLYEKQPFPKSKTKIRISYSDWPHVKLLLNNAKEFGVNNCVYIILKLIFSNAFHFVPCHFLMGPESSDYRNCSDETDSTVDINTWNLEFKKFWDSGRLQEAKIIQDEIKKSQKDLGIEHLFPDDTTMENLLKIGKLVAEGDESVFDFLNIDHKVPKPCNDTSIGRRRVKLKEQQLYAECGIPMSRHLKEKHANENNNIDIDNETEDGWLDIDSEKETKNESSLNDHENHLLELGIVSSKTISKTKKLKNSSTCVKPKDGEFQSDVPKESNQKAPKKLDKLETSAEKSPKPSTSKELSCLRSPNKCKHITKKSSWRKARIVGQYKPEKKIMKGKKIKYYEDSEEECV